MLECGAMRCDVTDRDEWTALCVGVVRQGYPDRNYGATIRQMDMDGRWGMERQLGLLVLFAHRYDTGGLC